MEEDELDTVLAQVGVSDANHMARLSKALSRWHHSGMTSLDIENETVEEEEPPQIEDEESDISATIRLQRDAHPEVIDADEGFMDGEEEAECF